MPDQAPSNIGKGRHDLVLLLLLVALAIVVAGVLVLYPSAVGYFNSDKAWELTTQFFLVAVLGGAVGFAYRLWEARRADDRQRLEQERERRALQRAALQEFYRSGVELHHEYKKIRRMMRASTVKAKSLIERQAFERLMERLEDCQLRAENMKSEVDLQKELFAEMQEVVFISLKRMEEYLRNLLVGFEAGYENRRKISATDLMELDPASAKFIMRREENPEIESELFKPAEQVWKLLLELIERTAPEAGDLMQPKSLQDLPATPHTSLS